MGSFDNSTNSFEQVSSPEKGKLQTWLDKHCITKGEVAVGATILAGSLAFGALVLKLDNNQKQSIRNDLTEQATKRIAGFSRVSDGSNENTTIASFNETRDGKIELIDGSICHIVYKHPDEDAFFPEHAEIVGLGDCPPKAK